MTRGGPLVLGGGLAGAATAMLLARGGAEVTLVEQYREARHKMCGEFLSTEACESLERLGMDVRALGAVAVRTLRLAGAGVLVERDLPFAAQSLTRRTLDEAMLALAVESGVRVERGRRVEALERAGELWRVRLAGGGAMQARDVFVASGKHDLRGHGRPEGVQGSLIAFKQYFRPGAEGAAALGGAIELMLFRGGYAGLQMVEGGCSNLSLLVEARRYREVGGSWAKLLEAMTGESVHLRERLRGAEAVLDRPLSLGRIPYGYVRRPGSAEGLWWLGDQVAVIPSFSGDGMSMALHSARVAAEVYLGGGEAEGVTARLAEEFGGLVKRATLLSRLMVSGSGQRLVVGAARVCPWLLPRVAEATRIPGWALARLGGQTEVSRPV